MRYPPFRKKLILAILPLSLTVAQGHAENDPTTTDAKSIPLLNRRLSSPEQPETSIPETKNESGKPGKALAHI